MGAFCLLVELQRWRVYVCSLRSRLVFNKQCFIFCLSRTFGALGPGPNCHPCQSSPWLQRREGPNMSPATTTIPTANMKDVPGKELKIAILPLICPSSVYHACFNPHPTPWILSIQVILGPLVRVWFRSTDSIPWVLVNIMDIVKTMSPCLYHKSLSTPRGT